MINTHRKPFIVLSVMTAFLLAFTATSVFAADGGSHKTPKNIIVFVSDGCGFNQIDATSIYQSGDTGGQVYESFPVTLAMSTYAFGGSYDPLLAWESFNYFNINPTDSAAAATAMSTGVKTYASAIGVDVTQNAVPNLIERCEDLDMATGVITSVEWTHATPASFVAHNVSRSNYAAIGQEMINDSAVDVIMGCGHPFYDDNGNLIATPNTLKYVGGEPTWNDLQAGTAGGDADGDGDADAWTLVQTRAEFQALMDGPTPSRVCGVAQAYQTLQFNRSGVGTAPYDEPLIETVPTLEEMTRAALNILDDDPDGLFLMVESGAVDWAGHYNASPRLIEEEIGFNNAVNAAIEWVENNSDWCETLIIVTGDHETGYLTGPDSGETADGPVWNELVNNGAGYLPGMEWNSNNHTNALIPFFTKHGRGEALFESTVNDTDPVRGDYIDNTDIANVLFGLLEDPTVTCPEGWVFNESCQCEKATLIALTELDALAGAKEVILIWATASEIDNAGFNVYRAESINGEYTLINDELIPGEGSAIEGALYSFTDDDVQNRKTYYYKLEDIDLKSTSTIHGPVSATPKLIYSGGQ